MCLGEAGRGEHVLEQVLFDRVVQDEAAVMLDELIDRLLGIGEAVHEAASVYNDFTPHAAAHTVSTPRKRVGQDALLALTTQSRHDLAAKT